jgi:glycine dehydrogenase subunit 2
MSRWHQATWDEKLLLEYKDKDLESYKQIVPNDFDDINIDPYLELPKNMIRDDEPMIPSLSELEIVRHYTRLSQMNYGVDLGPMPLGSCTMKYNPKVIDEISNSESIKWCHPLQEESTVQGNMEIIHTLQEWFKEITAMDECTLQIPAGSAGELAGVLIMKKYHGEKRDEVLVADSAHGTNPASAAMAGYKVVYIPTDIQGNVNIEALRAAISNKVAGFMLTNPNTLGIFERNITEIADIIHAIDGLLYYDGANLNGIIGITRPGDMGFDIVHLNLHKTFAVPHGGGGPGAGVLCVKEKLKKLLPKPIVIKKEGLYRFEWPDKTSIGEIKAFYGNFANLLRAFIYISMLGPKGLKAIAENSALSTNYFMAKMKEVQGYEIPFKNRARKHEIVISAKPLLKYGIRAEDVAKFLLNKGVYAPTIYFPPIVEEALMIEFTETEPKEVIDSYVNMLKEVEEIAKSIPNALKNMPERTSVSRIDLVYANHPKTAIPTYKHLVKLSRNVK